MPMPGGFGFGGDSGLDGAEGLSGGSGGDDTGHEDSGNEIERERVRRLTTATEEQTRARILAEIMKDPELVAVMRARQAGKKVRVIEDAGDDPAPQSSGAGQQPDQELDEDQLEGMSKKQFLGMILSSVGKKFDEFLSKKTKPLEDRLGNIEQTATTFTQEQTREKVAQVAKKYPDFWNFKDKMMQLSQQHVGLDAEELYLLAKAKSGQFVPKQNRVQLERPTNTSARPAAVKGESHTAQAINDLARQSLKSYFDANSERAWISDEEAQAYGG